MTIGSTVRKRLIRLSFFRKKDAEIFTTEAAMQHSLHQIQKNSKAPNQLYAERALFLGRMLAAALLISSGTACLGLTQAYPGSSRPDSETATLLPQGVSIVRVNGYSIPATSSGASILSGRNTVEFTVDESNFNSRERDPNVYTIELDAAAHTSYAITGRRGDARLCAFPILPETGQPDLANPAGCMKRK
jgi:hypothetical protein